jgi:hypothetical protein
MIDEDESAIEILRKFVKQKDLGYDEGSPSFYAIDAARAAVDEVAGQLQATTKRAEEAEADLKPEQGRAKKFQAALRSAEAEVSDLRAKVEELEGATGCRVCGCGCTSPTPEPAPAECLEFCPQCPAYLGPMQLVDGRCYSCGFGRPNDTANEGGTER